MDKEAKGKREIERAYIVGEKLDFFLNKIKVSFVQKDPIISQRNEYYDTTNLSEEEEIEKIDENYFNYFERLNNNEYLRFRENYIGSLFYNAEISYSTAKTNYEGIEIREQISMSFRDFEVYGFLHDLLYDTGFIIAFKLNKTRTEFILHELPSEWNPRELIHIEIDSNIQFWLEHKDIIQGWPTLENTIQLCIENTNEKIAKEILDDYEKALNLKEYRTKDNYFKRAVNKLNKNKEV